MRPHVVVMGLVVHAAWAHADRAPAQPDTIYGPALSLGYEYARSGAVGLNFLWAPENLPGGVVADRIATELELDVKVVPKWIFSGSVAAAPWVENPMRNTNDWYRGNFTLSATRSFEPEFGARSFLGLLPSITIGTVLPTRNRKLHAVVPNPLLDHFILYKRDTAGLLVGGHVRADVFVRNGLLFQTGPEFQILSEGDVIMCWQTLFGIGLWDAERYRFIAEYDYLRESGRPDLFIAPNDVIRETEEDGVRHTLDLGISAAIEPWLLIDARRSFRHFPDTRNGWTFSVHVEW